MTMRGCGGKIAARRRLLVGTALLCAQIVPAMAADTAPFDKSPIAPPFSWTGVYLRRRPRRRMVVHHPSRQPRNE
jgi:hypothetical protein